MEVGQAGNLGPWWDLAQKIVVQECNSIRELGPAQILCKWRCTSTIKYYNIFILNRPQNQGLHCSGEAYETTEESCNTHNCPGRLKWKQKVNN